MVVPVLACLVGRLQRVRDESDGWADRRPGWRLRQILLHRNHIGLRDPFLDVRIVYNWWRRRGARESGRSPPWAFDLWTSWSFGRGVHGKVYSLYLAFDGDWRRLAELRVGRERCAEIARGIPRLLTTGREGRD